MFISITNRFRSLNSGWGASVLAFLFLSVAGCSDGESQPVPSGPGDFMTRANGADISGTLFLPDGDGPFPVLIVVPGSGNEPKEDSYAFTDVFLPAGFGLYFYDKRGIGASTGTYPRESLENPFDFLNSRRDDVLSIIEMLSTHSDIQQNHVGLFGASQGAWVNTLVFEQSSEVDFILMSVGGVTPTGIENYYDGLTDDPNVSIGEATQLLYDYDGVIGFDPKPIVQNMSIPVGWIFGGKDRSHPTFYDIDVLESLNKPNFSIYLFENSNHELNDVTTGTFDPNLFPTVLSWLNSNGK